MITDMAFLFQVTAFNGDISKWNVSSVTNMDGMFSRATAFNGDISKWDVSSVTRMSDMLFGTRAFNGDISKWNVSSVTDMSNMFLYATKFNGDISEWDVSSVTRMSDMFDEATAFNGDISKWDVSSVTNMFGMFYDAKTFNGDISEWDVSSVTDMSNMFYSAKTFNGDISEWDVSSVTWMRSMFNEATAFNGDISEWDVSSVWDMDSMFRQTKAFNGDISKWDVSSVTDMDGMFSDAKTFNGDISEWDVSSVTMMEVMFSDATAFNGDISKWDVSSVTNMDGMFYDAKTFNGDISEWDVSSVKRMDFMFYRATAFEQTLCWNLTSVPEPYSVFDGSGGGGRLWDINDPKCGKCASTTWDISGALHRLRLQFTKKRESSDPDGTDDIEIETIALIVPHLHPLFCISVRGDESYATNNVTIQHERQKIVLESQRYIADIAINQDILFLAESRIREFKRENGNGIAVSLEVLDVIRNNRTVSSDSTNVVSHGDTLVVSARVDHGEEEYWRQNIVDIYRIDEDGWESGPPFQQLRMTREGHFDYALGAKSILHGDTIVVQPTFGHVTVTGDEARFAYPSDPVLHIFERNTVTATARNGVATALDAFTADGQWDETQRLGPGEPVSSMGIDDNTLVLVTTNSQHILVYTKDVIDSAGRWQLMQSFNESLRELFNYQVAIHRNVFVVAGRHPDSGEALVFERPGADGKWNQTDTLVSPDVVEFDKVVAVYNEVIVLGTAMNLNQFRNGQRAELRFFEKYGRHNVSLGLDPPITQRSIESRGIWQLTRRLQTRDQLVRWFSSIDMDQDTIAAVGQGQTLNAAAYLFDKNTKDDDESSKPTLSPTNTPSCAPVGWAKSRRARLVVGVTLLVALAH
jgi:surface protein